MFNTTSSFWRAAIVAIAFVFLGPLANASVLTTNSSVNGWQDYANIFSLTTSADGPGRSYRHFLEGTGAFAGNPNSPGKQLEFWGSPGGNFRPDSDGSYFTEDSFPASTQATLLIEIAGWRDRNWLGYYELADPTKVYTIFSGADEANDNNSDFTLSPLTKSFSVNGNWALLFMPNFHSSQKPTFAQVAAAGFVQNGVNNSQFLINRDTVNQFYYIGVEDTLKGDGDHNDMIFRIRRTEAHSDVPEPSTYAMIGVVLLGLACLRGKR